VLWGRNVMRGIVVSYQSPLHKVQYDTGGEHCHNMLEELFQFDYLSGDDSDQH
jgi:hypothetical protein